MNVLNTLRNGVHDHSRNGAAVDASPTDASQALTDRYARLDERKAIGSLPQLTQVELTAIEAFERANRDRSPVLSKLRYLRQREPLPGYDALEPDAIGDALSDAELGTIKAAREYERKLRGRPLVLAEIARAVHRAGAQRPAAADDSGAYVQPLR